MGTERDGAGVIRIQFPGGDAPNELEPIAWTDFFSEFDDNKSAFLYQETTSDGQLGRFDKLIRR